MSETAKCAHKRADGSVCGAYEIASFHHVPQNANEASNPFYHVFVAPAPEGAVAPPICANFKCEHTRYSRVPCHCGCNDPALTDEERRVYDRPVAPPAPREPQELNVAASPAHESKPLGSDEPLNETTSKSTGEGNPRGVDGKSPSQHSPAALLDTGEGSEPTLSSDTQGYIDALEAKLAATLTERDTLVAAARDDTDALERIVLAANKALPDYLGVTFQQVREVLRAALPPSPADRTEETT